MYTMHNTQHTAGMQRRQEHYRQFWHFICRRQNAENFFHCVLLWLCAHPVHLGNHILLTFNILFDLDIKFNIKTPAKSPCRTQWNRKLVAISTKTTHSTRPTRKMYKSWQFMWVNKGYLCQVVLLFSENCLFTPTMILSLCIYLGSNIAAERTG